MDFLWGFDRCVVGLHGLWRFRSKNCSHNYFFHEHNCDQQRPERHAELAGVQCDVGHHYCFCRVVHSQYRDGFADVRQRAGFAHGDNNLHCNCVGIGRQQCAADRYGSSCVQCASADYAIHRIAHRSERWADDHFHMDDYKRDVNRDLSGHTGRR